jgi:hypothetical protein
MKLLLERLKMFKSGDYVTVSGYSGIAWYLQGKEQVWVEDEFDLPADADEFEMDAYYDMRDGEWIDGNDWIAIMIGDDREFTFEESELTKLDEDVCSCGQINCGWDNNG